MRNWLFFFDRSLHIRKHTSALENILQCKLHDPGTARSAGRCVCRRAARGGAGACGRTENPAESIRLPQRYAGIARPQAVGDIESFGTNLDTLLFPDVELPR